MIQNIKRSLALLSIAYAVNLSAQTTYKACVINKDTGEPIIGAVVRGNKGVEAVTNEDGYFSLNTNDDQTLYISYIGFKEQNIKAQSLKEQSTISLIPGIDLKEVLVTASISSARSQKALGSKVDHIDVTNLSKNAHTNSLSDILDGKIGGVQMYQSNGKVGMPIRFNMRSGATMSMERDPIIYVDGVKYNNSNISDINSSQDALSALNDLAIDDIATIDVIKGPSAAASYGAEAANGVIVITTKRGKTNNAENRKADIQVKMSLGAATLARKYDQFV
ncbi:TonB-dependent receptor plug domain-containing protein, partial [Prevotella scopos]